MANADNLIPNEKRTPSERRENARKAGKASGKARRRKKAMRQAAASLLNMELSGAKGDSINKVRQLLRSFGLDEDEATFQDAMLVSVMIKALKGDVQATAFLRDTAGENPQLGMRKEELKLRKEELKLKRDALMGGEKNDRDENNLLDAIKGVEEVDTRDLPEIE